jgi:hypothetical protein
MTHRFASRRIRISRGTHDTRRFRNASCLERPPLGPWRCRGNAGGEVESSSTFGFGQSEPLVAASGPGISSHPGRMSPSSRCCTIISRTVGTRTHSRARSARGTWTRRPCAGRWRGGRRSARRAHWRHEGVEFRHQPDRHRCADCTSGKESLVVLDTDQALRSVARNEHHRRLAPAEERHGRTIGERRHGFVCSTLGSFGLRDGTRPAPPSHARSDAVQFLTTAA